MNERRDPSEIDYVGPTRDPTTRTRKMLDIARLVLAIALAFSYVLLVSVLLIANLFFAYDPEKLDTLHGTLLVPLGTMVGVIIGFYFGASSKS